VGRKLSPYLTGNILRLHYRAQPVNAVCWENNTEHANALCGQNAEFWYVKASGTCSNHRALKGLVNFLLDRKKFLFVYTMLLRNYLDLLISCLLRTVVNPTSAKH
jgi:hypothetical protein